MNSRISKIADEIWKNCIGEKSTKAFDAFGFRINYYDYNSNNDTSWTLDHVWPLKNNVIPGSKSFDNLQVLSKKANELKANHTQGKINGCTFSVSKEYDENNKRVGRMSIKDKNNNWFWAYDDWK